MVSLTCTWTHIEKSEYPLHIDSVTRGLTVIEDMSTEHTPEIISPRAGRVGEYGEERV